MMIKLLSCAFLIWSRAICCAVLCLCVVLSATAYAELYINEIFYDPPSSPDSPREYIELRGTPGMSLNDCYLLFIENEDNVTHSGGAGNVDTLFDLNGYTVGSNGFLTLRQKSNLFSVDPGATNLINSGSGAGWGSSSSTSSIGAWDEGGEGEIENGGFTAMLIHNNGATINPATLLGSDLDFGNDGLDDLVTGGEHWQLQNTETGLDWTIVDAIGIHSEFGEAATGRLYAPINFGPEATSNIEAGATYVGTGFEIELIARWGNSTGQTPDDWHITNVTDNAASGSQGATDLRQSGDPHPANDGNPSTPPPQPPMVESNNGVPYGTQLTNTLGRPNFIFGDYNKDGHVDAADYTVWRDTLSETGTDVADLPADANHNYVVDDADYLIWKQNFGSPGANGGGGAGSLTATSTVGPVGVPEPASIGLVVIGLVAMAAAYRRSG
jgi:hypothetical protein